MTFHHDVWRASFSSTSSPCCFCRVLLRYLHCFIRRPFTSPLSRLLGFSSCRALWQREGEKELYVLWANKRDYESSVPRASNEYTYDIIRKRIVIAFARRIRDAKIDTPIFARYWPYELCIKTRCLIYARLACATANVNVDVVWRRRRVPASNIGNEQQRNG